MYINGYLSGVSYSRMEGELDENETSFDEASKETVLLIKVKTFELCAVQIPVVENFQHFVRRFKVVRITHLVSLFLCIAISILLSGGLIFEGAHLATNELIQFLRGVLFWLPAVLIVFVRYTMRASVNQVRKKLYSECISNNEWIPLSALNSKVLDKQKLDFGQNAFSFVVHILMICAGYYFMTALDMYWMYYVIQWVVARIVMTNYALFSMGIHWAAWLKWKKNHR